MTLLEQKVDAIARCLLANDFTDRNAAVAELAELMKKPIQAAQGADYIIRNLLVELGVPDHILGHRYLVTALTIAAKDQTAVDAISGYLYPTVAAQYNTTGSRVERAIRHAIEVAWDRGDLEVMAKYFGNTIDPSKGKPTNSEFIAHMANVIRDKTNYTN